ncbi:DUF2259 domain-containing protein [Rhizobium sp. TRM95111]|uniref:DUF2259 domain-containing protein n=1 Tax=Rhizobium alarense TaxID=2846851 RepID=UPI001F16FB63|nr:DUF2259 domain-containing protein [Rhizobium alarense]MCF3639040.1 DUF2259 domain-containing protein [Rhizobium alarense]
MKRLAAAALTINLLGAAVVAPAAVAGDFAGLDPLGFSADGQVFAFEEFGTQDGSGFPYSNLYFIDTQADRYLPGTPVRVRLDDESAGLGAARAKSRQQARTLIERYRPEDNPGLLAAFNAPTELNVGKTTLRYRAFAVEPPAGEPFTVALAEIDLPVAEKCRDLSPESGVGFRLTLTETDGTPADRLIHEDDRVPESRNCPLSYQLSGAMTYHPLGAPAVHVALVLVRSLGFEGADGRWIAVPFRP